MTHYTRPGKTQAEELRRARQTKLIATWRPFDAPRSGTFACHRVMIFDADAGGWRAMAIVTDKGTHNLLLSPREMARLGQRILKVAGVTADAHEKQGGEK